MAAFRKRNGGWRAEVCIKGIRTLATFTTKREAQAWAAQEETKLREDLAGLCQTSFSTACSNAIAAKSVQKSVELCESKI